MSIEYAEIHRQDRAIAKHTEGLQRAEDRRREAIMEEARLAAARRSEKDRRRDEARATLNSISAAESQLEQDNEKHRASYIQATYEGDTDAAQHHQDAGEVARTRLEQVRQQKDEAARKLDAVSFDEDFSDDVYKNEINALKSLLTGLDTMEQYRLLNPITGTVDEAMRERDRAKSERERQARAERREQVLSRYRDVHGVVRSPKGGVRDPESGAVIA